MSTVLVHVYNILMEGWGLLLENWWEDISDIIGHEGALYVPPSGDFLVVVVCVVELCVMLVLVYSLSL